MSLIDIIRPRHIAKIKAARRVRMCNPVERQPRNIPKGLGKREKWRISQKLWREEHLERARQTWRRYYWRKHKELKEKQLKRWHERYSPSRVVTDGRS